jgi:hypothetical protein
MPAQVFDFKNDRMPIVELDGLWRFHTGDDPRWSDPNFDDSNWPLLHSDQPWTAQGYKGYGGMAWYRFKVLIPEQHKDLAILVPNFTTTYQIFVNGKLIASVGKMPPTPGVLDPVIHVHPIPNDAIDNGRSMSVAIRVWHWPLWAGYYGGGPGGSLYIGEADRIDDQKWLNILSDYWDLSATNILIVIDLLAGIAGLAWFWSRKAEREYLWFALSSLTQAAELLREDYWRFLETSYVTTNLLGDSLKLLDPFFFLLFTVSLLRQRRNSLFWVAVIVLGIRLLLTYPIVMGWISTPVMYSLWCISLFPTYACILTFLIRGVRRGDRDARLIVAPVALLLITESYRYLIHALSSIGGSRYTQYTVGEMFWFRPLTIWPFPVYPRNVVLLLMQLSILAILLRRFVRARKDEGRMASELESARTVQSVLIPSGAPVVRGFSIASVYKPALQVGGDFFQIIPNGEVGVLIVIGDVSGKGMPAAMTVALLVGTIRTLAHYTQSPSEILSAVNARMLARSAGGFTTCLVLRADSDGTFAVANAGHIAPYLNGAELPLQNALPLGLDAGTSYAESTFRIGQGDQLTLMTDGVVEARNKTGELYGFDRTARIASHSAESIARAAQEFGQEDDITVVTLVRQSVEASADIPASTPSLSALPGT